MSLSFICLCRRYHSKQDKTDPCKNLHIEESWHGRLLFNQDRRIIAHENNKTSYRWAGLSSAKNWTANWFKFLEPSQVWTIEVWDKCGRGAQHPTRFTRSPGAYFRVGSFVGRFNFMSIFTPQRTQSLKFLPVSTLGAHFFWKLIIKCQIYPSWLLW